jgi:hypothetical protein
MNAMSRMITSQRIGLPVLFETEIIRNEITRFIPPVACSIGYLDAGMRDGG